MATESKSSNSRGIGRIGAYLGRLGPTWLAGAIAAGPATMGSLLVAGASFEYALLWVVVLSAILGTVGQYLAMRLGLLTEAGIVSVAERHLGSFWAWVLVIDAVLAAGLAQIVIMAVVLGWGEELNDRLDDDDERAMLERMLDTTQHTIELTETLQAFTELWDDDGDRATNPVSLEAMLAETLERRREAYADVEFVVDGSIPAVTVSAGPLLSTVFRNLLNNAVQHNDAADPRVVIAADTGPETATVRIADNGPGVPADRRDAVFGRGEMGLESEGSGVGLYLVDTLVSQYGGDVWIESSELGGAAVVVELQRYRE